MAAVLQGFLGHLFKAFPGDRSWEIWAPGRTNPCQCDLSTMFSPKLFEELVVPEIEEISRHVDYIIWHLDGPEEYKFLDILLDLPQVKAVEWVHVAGKPPATEYLPYLRKIQSKRRSLLLHPENEKEIVALLNELSCEGIYFSGGFTGKTELEAQALIKTVERLSKK